MATLYSPRILSIVICVIENTIYMIGSLNNDFYDLTLENYGLFYFDSTEISSSEEDTIIEIKNVLDSNKIPKENQECKICSFVSSHKEVTKR